MLKKFTDWLRRRPATPVSRGSSSSEGSIEHASFAEPVGSYQSIHLSQISDTSLSQVSAAEPVGSGRSNPIPIPHSDQKDHEPMCSDGEYSDAEPMPQPPGHELLQVPRIPRSEIPWPLEWLDDYDSDNTDAPTIAMPQPPASESVDEKELSNQSQADVDSGKAELRINIPN